MWAGRGCGAVGFSAVGEAGSGPGGFDRGLSGCAGRGAAEPGGVASAVRLGCGRFGRNARAGGGVRDRVRPDVADHRDVRAADAGRGGVVPGRGVVHGRAPGQRPIRPGRCWYSIRYIPSRGVDRVVTAGRAARGASGRGAAAAGIANPGGATGRSRRGGVGTARGRGRARDLLDAARCGADRTRRASAVPGVDPRPVGGHGYADARRCRAVPGI